MFGTWSSGVGAAPKIAGLEERLLLAASICSTDSRTRAHSPSGICAHAFAVLGFKGRRMRSAYLGTAP